MKNPPHCSCRGCNHCGLEQLVPLSSLCSSGCCAPTTTRVTVEVPSTTRGIVILTVVKPVGWGNPGHHELRLPDLHLDLGTIFCFHGLVELPGLFHVSINDDPLASLIERVVKNFICQFTQSLALVVGDIAVNLGLPLC